jgi:hypothetical protein
MVDQPIGILKPIVFHFIWRLKDQEVARNLLTYRYNQFDKRLKMRKTWFYQWIASYGNNEW